MATLLDTDDGSQWAEEFCRIFTVTPVIGVIPTDEDPKDWQEGLMISWFANAIETGKNHHRTADPTGPMTAFLHFYNLDHANAAIHCGQVRYSPVTFRLQEYMIEAHPVEACQDSRITEVMEHNGKYQEDRGRE